uniref:Uncharacterized protein n=1 Tax=Lactuca sativa TaxID=4236 RepID=A0A9R1XJ64_LACSA|nr:hypothetical protein LSAT_V11C300132540 [Lactuca sativa]
MRITTNMGLCFLAKSKEATTSWLFPLTYTVVGACISPLGPAFSFPFVLNSGSRSEAVEKLLEHPLATPFNIDNSSIASILLLSLIEPRTEYNTMEKNNASQLVFDKVADIDASKECFNIHGTKIHETIKKNLILVFESLFDEGVIRNISSSDISRNEGDYMLVPHKDKTNFYKTTTIRVSTNFIDRVDSSHFASFPDLLANNFDTRIAFSMFFIIIFLGRLCRWILCESLLRMERKNVALWDNFALKLNTYISEHQNDTAPVMIFYVWPTSKLVMFLHVNLKLITVRLVVANPEHYYLRFPIKNIDDIPDYSKVAKNDDDSATKPFMCDGFGRVSSLHGKVIVRVQDKSGSSSFVLFEHHVKDLLHRGKQSFMEKISKDQGLQNIPDEFKILLNRKFVLKVWISVFNLENNFITYTMHKLAEDESVLAQVFKRSPAYEQQIVHDDGTYRNNFFKPLIVELLKSLLNYL